MQFHGAGERETLVGSCRGRVCLQREKNVGDHSPDLHTDRGGLARPAKVSLVIRMYFMPALEM